MKVSQSVFTTLHHDGAHGLHDRTPERTAYTSPTVDKVVPDGTDRPNRSSSECEGGIRFTGQGSHALSTGRAAALPSLSSLKLMRAGRGHRKPVGLAQQRWHFI